MSVIRSPGKCLTSLIYSLQKNCAGAIHIDISKPFLSTVVSGMLKTDFEICLPVTTIARFPNVIFSCILFTCHSRQVTRTITLSPLLPDLNDQNTNHFKRVYAVLSTSSRNAPAAPQSTVSRNTKSHVFSDAPTCCFTDMLERALQNEQLLLAKIHTRILQNVW